MSEVPRIYLTGPMASGKSTVGSLLARTLGWSFLDLDEHIEEKEEKSIPEIFNESGEPYFREIESTALRGTAHHSDTVVATGGGALVQPNAMQWAREHGVVVYLKVDVDDLVERARSDGGGRPLLDVPREQIAQQIRSMLDARCAIYEQADVTVDASAHPRAVVQRVLTAIQDPLSRKE